MEIVSHSEEETLQIGRRIGRQLKPPRVVLLEGQLGTGKTVLTRGLCQGLGIEEGIVVHSPTFTLVNQYPSRQGLIHHVDLYRLETLRDLYSIGIEDLLASSSVVIVEWAEKLRLPVEDPLRIRLRFNSDPSIRVLAIEPPLSLER